MYELILVACSLVQGAQCREVPAISIENSVTAISCAVASQIEAAKWAADHPNYYVHRMTCQPAGRYSKA